MKILVTSGGTTENIDSVRSITNFSTGNTGAAITNHLTKFFSVTHIRSHNATSSTAKDVITYSSYDDLFNSMKKALSDIHYDVIIHSAAVSDYSVSKILVNNMELNGNEKIPSNQNLKIELKPNKKIIDYIREFSKNKKIKIIGFKLTTNTSKEKLNEILTDFFNRSDIDYIVHNDLNQITETTHPATIYRFDKQEQQLNPAHHTQTKESLALKLEEIIRSFK